MQKLLLLIVVGFCSAIASAQSVTLANIPALDSQGKTVQGGSLYVTWSSFNGNNGTLVQAGSRSALIQNGVFTITLAASDNAGWPYNALIMGGAAPAVYLWKIPAAGGITSISQMSKPTPNITSSVTLSGISTTVASLTGLPISGNCAGAWDSHGNLIPASAPCANGSGAGAGTTGQFAYYSSNGTSVAGHTLAAADIPALNYQAALGYIPLNAANNLSDVASESSARANLGLGSAATQPSSAFQPAGSYLPASNPLIAVGSCFGGYYQAGNPVTQYQTVVINTSGTIQPAGTAGGGALGIAQSNASSGTVGVCFEGVSQVVFDGTAVVGDVAITSTSSGGQGHDSGQTSRNSIGLQVGVLGTITTGCTGVACLGAANIEGLNRTGRQILGSYLPNPSSSTLGGMQSAAAVSHKWINSISTVGVPALSQPACGDLSNSQASCSTDTTNASNIGSGTLAAARLPATFTANAVPAITSISAQAVVGSGSSMTISAPSSISNGNALIAVIKIDQVPNTQTFTIPTGFAQIGSTIASVASGKTLLAIFCKTASGESGNYTFGWTTAGSLLAVGYILNVAGASCTNDGLGTVTGNAATLTVGSFNTSQANDLLVLAATQSGSPNGFTPTTPGNISKQNNAAGVYIGAVPNGAGPTPSTTLTSTNSAGALSNDFVAALIAFPATATSNAPPLTNSTSSAASLASANLTGGIQAGGQVQALNFAVANAAGGLTPTNSYSIYSTNGTLWPEMLLNANNNLALDPGLHSGYVQIGNAAKGGAILIIGSGSMDYISQDALQDLQAMHVDVDNNLYFGGTGTASEQGDLILESPPAGVIHVAPNGIDMVAVDNTNGLTVANMATLGNQTLANGALTSGTNWIVTGDFALASNTAIYTDSTHAGTLSQASGSLAAASIPNTRYLFSYVVSNSTQAAFPPGNPACTITTAFASVATQLPMINGNQTITFTSAATPGNFVISCTSSGHSFTITTLSLKPTAGGNLNVAGTSTAKSQAGAGTATFSINPNAGTGATVPACVASAPNHVCDSISGDVAYTTGNAPAAGAQFIITTGITRTNAPNCNVRFYGGAVALAEQYPAPTATTLVAGVGIAPAATTSYTVHYDCWGN